MATVLSSSDPLDPKSFEWRLSQGSISDEELAQLAGLKTVQIGEFREIFRIFDSNGDGFIDQDELRRMMQSLHFDNLLLSDEYYQDLIKRVKGSQVDFFSGQELYFSFAELMLSMLKRPVVKYSKREVLQAFSFISGKSDQASPGFISEEKLSRALYHGNGGADPSLVEEIMTMVEHNTGGKLNYDELVDLMMGETQPSQPSYSFGTTAGHSAANARSRKVHRRGHK